MIDFIGDIHGHADELKALLKKMGYEKNNGGYAHPERKALFIGDYIDRGPNIRETLHIVRTMVEHDQAIALMGNHEFNALCFHMEDPNGGQVRPHLIKNIIQHYETLRQFQNRQKEYESYLQWFKTLPLYYETNDFRAVHACWDDDNIAFLRKVLKDDRLSDTHLFQSVVEESKIKDALEQTLKGKEMRLPDGLSFQDKDGTERQHIRIKWWEDPADMTYRSICVEPILSLNDDPVDMSLLRSQSHYHASQKPVFFGHYWLRGNPNIYRENICCIDYSVAKQGKLVAYRYDGEKILDGRKMVWI